MSSRLWPDLKAASAIAVGGNAPARLSNDGAAGFDFLEAANQRDAAELFLH